MAQKIDRLMGRETDGLRGRGEKRTGALKLHERGEETAGCSAGRGRGG
jgi:hypothetical protein